MIRYQTANVQVTDVRISSRNNEVESMAGCVGRLGDVLSTAERLQQLGKTYSVHVVTLVDVYIKIATDDNWTAVRRQLLKGRRQFVEEQRRERLTAGPVETEQNEATVTSLIVTSLLQPTGYTIQNAFGYSAYLQRSALSSDVCWGS